MKPIDFIKAIGVAFGLLVMNVLVAVLVVVAYRFLIEPGHPSEFYDVAAMKIAPWCSHIAGTALFFVFSYLLTAGRPDRNGLLFAAVFTLCYAIIDAATVAFDCFEVEFMLSMLAKLLAALAGAYLASRVTAKRAATSES